MTSTPSLSVASIPPETDSARFDSARTLGVMPILLPLTFESGTHELGNAGVPSHDFMWEALPHPAVHTET